LPTQLAKDLPASTGMTQWIDENGQYRIRQFLLDADDNKRKRAAKMKQWKRLE